MLFDLGDTIIQYGDIDRRAVFTQAVWRTYRLWSQRQRRMPDFRRYYLHQWFAMRWGYFKLLLLRREMDAMRLMRRACRKLWLTAPEEFFTELAWNWYKPLADSATLEPGTHAMLTALRDRGLRLAIVSNTFVPGFVLDRHLENLGLIEFFPQRIYSCDVGYRKPNRHIYQIALERVGVTPGEAVFVGDLLDVDVHGAQRVGLQCVWKHPPHVDAAHAPVPAGTRVIERLSELPAILAAMNG